MTTTPSSVQFITCDCGTRLPMIGLRPGDQFACPKCAQGYAVPIRPAPAALSPAPLPRSRSGGSSGYVIPTPPLGTPPPTMAFETVSLPHTHPTRRAAPSDSPLPAPPPGMPDTLPVPTSGPAATPTRAKFNPDEMALVIPGESAARAPAEPGAAVESFGPFKILDTLGSGGMGVVYKAHDPRLDRTVAIKVISDALTAEPEIRDRFLREARAAASLNHPNVVGVHDIDAVDGRTYLVMEYIDGASLQDLLHERKHLPWEQACNYVLQAARGLAAAAAKGIVHRDVKPSNIMVTREGLVKITDFGLAKPTSAPTGVTQTGFVIGTPLYMAPEQGRGLPCDFRADIYALGGTLYHLIAGRPPYESENAGDLIVHHASSPVPELPRVQSVPPALRAILHRMLAKDPLERYATYDELLRDLESMLVVPTVYARLGRRAVATLIDLALLMIADQALEWTVRRAGTVNIEDFPMLWAPLSFALGAIYFVESQRRRGQTVGKRFLGLVLHARDGRFARPKRLFIRYALSWGILDLATSWLQQQDTLLQYEQYRTFNTLIGAPITVLLSTLTAVVLIGFLIPLFSRERRALHDILAGTVVTVKPALVRKWQQEAVL